MYKLVKSLNCRFLLILVFLSITYIFSKPVEWKLDNGLSVLFIQRDGLPLVTVSLWVNAGSRYENKGNNGIAHFFEHIVFRRGKENKEALGKLVEAMGGEINAITSKDYVNFYFTIPAKHLSRALKLLSQNVFYPTLNEQDIEEEKRVVIEEIVGVFSSSQQYIWNYFNYFIFSANPYGYPVVGNVEVVKKLNYKSLKKWHQKFYQPSNMYLVIVGDINITNLQTQINESFGQIKGEEIKLPHISPFKLGETSWKEELTMGQNYTQLLIGYPGPGMYSDREDIPPIDVLCFYLGQGEESFLNTQLVQREKLAIDVSANYYTSYYPSPFVIWANTEKEKVKQVENEIYSLLNSLPSLSPGEEELSRAKQLLLANYILSQDSVMGIAENLGFYWLMGNWEWAEEYIKEVKDVTWDDLIKVFYKYIFKKKKCVLIVY